MSLFYLSSRFLFIRSQEILDNFLFLRLAFSIFCDYLPPRIPVMTGSNVYKYDPSQAAAIIFVILFAITTIWHVWIMFKLRTFYFVVLITGGGRKPYSSRGLLPSPTDSFETLLKQPS